MIHIFESDFAKVKLLGRGAYGKVYLYKSVTGKENTQQLVAVKKLNLKGSDHSSREFEIRQALGDCPHLLEFTGKYNKIKAHGQSLMLVMPLGMPLSKAIVKPKRETCIAVMQGLLRGLSRMHELGFMHRDIKPDNILICGKRAVLSDFGTACRISEVDSGPAFTRNYKPL